MPNRSPVLHFPSSTPPAPSETEAGVPDQAARDQALDVTASWIVEAPAGSGKTGLLMQRYLKLLAHESVSQPEEILAVTFTRKATSELRERVLEQLDQAASALSGLESDKPLSPFDAASRRFAIGALKRDAALGWRLLEQPQRLNIRTIDSVCADIANTLPLLSGSGGPRTPSEHPEQLYRLAARRTLMQLGGPDAALSAAIRNVLLHRDGSLADCEGLLARMLAAREQWGELVPLGAQLEGHVLETKVRPKLERALEQIVCTGLTRASKAMPPDMLAGLAWLAGSMSREPGYKRESPLAICANRNEPPEERAEHLEHWLVLIGLLIKKDGEWRNRILRADVGFEITPAGRTRLMEILEEARGSERLREALCAVRALPPARYPDNQWEVAKALFRLLLRALAELKVLFAERQQCDFTELALAAKEALHAEGGAADLASAAGSSLRHLLVDEMQDTSSSQYELIEMLSRSWDGHSQTLFLVGDPKQSIYLFRQARVERFIRTIREERIGDVPLGALQLTSNFRSQSTLVSHFNHDFSLVFPIDEADQGDSNAALDVPFVRAEAVRGASSPETGIAWNTSILDDFSPDGLPLDGKRERRRHALAEARAVRRVVEEWRARPLPDGRTEPWRIAVLARARTHLGPIIAEFDRPDADGGTIPFRALEIEQLGERPEVLDALALTRALLHPADRVAWLAVLHAPWCGLGLADLLAISGGGTPEAAREALPAVIGARRDLLSAEGRQLFERAWPVLAAALAQRGRTSTATWVERTWRSLGGDAALSARELANVDLFFVALREVEEPGGRVELARLNAGVRGLYAEPRSGDGLVDLSTIHKAKGLEWDVVLVPALERQGQASRSELLNWLEVDSADDEAAHVILAPIWGKGDEPDALHKWLSGIRSAREAAERKRLYYVACTRAREELHLFAAATRKKDGELCARAGTLLQACWPAALLHFGGAGLDDVAHPAGGASSTADMFLRSLELEQPGGEGFAIAAGADQQPAPAAANRPLLHRFPLDFNPRLRFEAAAASRLPYSPAPAMHHGPTVERPEGSFAFRAFGNVVHRFLQLLAGRLEANPDAHALLRDLPGWLPRLSAALRSEGLPPAGLERLAERSLQALQQAVADDTGRWILSPHPGSHSEQTLRLADANLGEMRVDRTFLAGADPLSEGSTHLWIIDFKTTERGSRSPELFAAQERAKYEAQLASYARAQRALRVAPRDIVVGLYYPLEPRLIHWDGSA